MLADGTDFNFIQMSKLLSPGVPWRCSSFPSSEIFLLKMAGSSGYGVCRPLVHARDVTNGASDVKERKNGWNAFICGWNRIQVESRWTVSRRKGHGGQSALRVLWFCSSWTEWMEFYSSWTALQLCFWVQVDWTKRLSANSRNVERHLSRSPHFKVILQANGWSHWVRLKRWFVVQFQGYRMV